MPKIVQFNLPGGGTVVQLPDNTSDALDIEAINADGSRDDYITIDTTNSGEKISLSQKTVVADGTASGNIGQVQTNADAFIIDSTNDTGMSICLTGNDPGRISFVGQDSADIVGFRATASNTTTNQLVMLTNGEDRIKINSVGVTKITGPGGTTGDTAPTGAAAPTLYLESSTGSSQDRCTLLMNADGPSGSNLDMNYGGNRKLLITAQDAAQSITFEDDLKIKNESTDAAVLTIANSGVDVTGGFTGTGSGTVGTGGASSTTLEQASASTFQTELHVGAAIKITNPSTGAITLRTVASITDANTLEMDEAATLPAGCSWKYDSGELFAVKTGDSKSILAVTGEGGLVLNSTGADSGIYNNLAIGDSDILSKITTANRNYIIGHSNADWDITSADSCVIMGYNAGVQVSSGSNNTIVGGYAGDAVTTQQFVTAIGSAAGRSAGGSSTHVGRNAGAAATGTNNTSVGKDAMSAFTGAFGKGTDA